MILAAGPRPSCWGAPLQVRRERGCCSSLKMAERKLFLEQVKAVACFLQRRFYLCLACLPRGLWPLAPEQGTFTRPAGRQTPCDEWLLCAACGRVCR